MVWLCIIPIWLLCAVATSQLSISNGKSGVTGFVVGLVFGPIGVILALLDRVTNR